MGLFGIGSKKKLEALWAICQKHSRMLSVGAMPPEEIIRANIMQMISTGLRINKDCAAILQSNVINKLIEQQAILSESGRTYAAHVEIEILPGGPVPEDALAAQAHAGCL